MKPFELAQSLKFYGDPSLRTIAFPISVVTDETSLLIEEMSRLMVAFGAVGLAANQVGVLKRVIVIDEGLSKQSNAHKILALINPEIIHFGDENKSEGEGCLSLPGIWKSITRSVRITVKYLDFTGTPQVIDVEGFKARVIQHEVDHLNGILILDRG